MAKVRRESGEFFAIESYPVEAIVRCGSGRRPVKGQPVIWVGVTSVDGCISDHAFTCWHPISGVAWACPSRAAASGGISRGFPASPKHLSGLLDVEGRPHVNLYTVIQASSSRHVSPAEILGRVR